MASVSGLSADHRKKAREIAYKAALLGFQRRDEIHYTQGAMRWQGINENLRAWKGQFPRHADCSAFATWCIWNGLAHFNVRDTVNGANWKAGFTGTMLRHGKRVMHRDNILRGDCVIYGQKGTVGAHTAICIGGGMVISHG